MIKKVFTGNKKPIRVTYFLAKNRVNAGLIFAFWPIDQPFIAATGAQAFIFLSP
jgi:hypothetical protein